MANPFAYEEYRKEKIRQKIDESRTQRVNIQVGDSTREPYDPCAYIPNATVSSRSFKLTPKCLRTFGCGENSFYWSLTALRWNDLVC